ncbi:MAG: hypothetical protein ABIZ04_07400 [Opitutus sp.]
MNTENSASSSQPLSPASVTGIGSRVSITSDSGPVSAAGFAGRGEAHAPAPRPPENSGGGLLRPTLPGDFVGSLLDRIAGWLSPAFVERSLSQARSWGQYAVMGGVALTLLYAIYAAIKFNSFAFFMTGVALIAALAVAQFAAIRFLTAATRTIANTPSQISSPAFLECSGLLLLLASAGTLIGGVVAAIRLESSAPLLPAILIGATLLYAGATALHPKLVNVELGLNSAGEESVGLLSFFFKAALKLVPIFFVLLAVAGDLAILASFTQNGQAFAASIGSVLQFIPMPLPLDTTAGFTGSAVVMMGALLPMIGYFLFLLGYLSIDLVRAVLAVPTKLEALRR